jgi:hypothetical protein
LTSSEPAFDDPHYTRPEHNVAPALAACTANGRTGAIMRGANVSSTTVMKIKISAAHRTAPAAGAGHRFIAANSLVIGGPPRAGGA